MPKIKVKAVEAQDPKPEFDMEFHADTDWEKEWEEPEAINVREEYKPRIEVNYNSEARNDEFDATYKGKQDKTPLYKQWWFWLIITALVLGGLIAWYHYSDAQKSGKLESVSATTAVSTTASDSATGTGVSVNEYVVPAGASVVEGSEGWGLYKSDGTLVRSFTGIAANSYGTWYIRNGLADFSYTGNLTINDTTYRVEKGKVDVDDPVKEATTAAASGNATDSQKKAMESAADHLVDMAFSRPHLIAQLQSEGFSEADATYAADHSNIDWNQQAYYKAQEYLALTTFSHQDLVDQLVLDQFTNEQAEYGVTKSGL